MLLSLSLALSTRLIFPSSSKGLAGTLTVDWWFVVLCGAQMDVRDGRGHQVLAVLSGTAAAAEALVQRQHPNPHAKAASPWPFCRFWLPLLPECCLVECWQCCVDGRSHQRPTLLRLHAVLCRTRLLLPFGHPTAQCWKSQIQKRYTITWLDLC